jgi:hypothetical protein
MRCQIKVSQVLLQPATAGAVPDDVGAGSQCQLLEGAGFVGFDGLRADRQPCRDFLVAHALRGVAQHVLLPGAEIGLGGRYARLGRARDGLARDGWIQEQPACGHGPYRTHQFVGCGALEQIAACASLQHLMQIWLVLVPGERQQADCRAVLGNPPGQFDPSQAGHRNVDNRDVWQHGLDGSVSSRAILTKLDCGLGELLTRPA